MPHLPISICLVADGVPRIYTHTRGHVNLSCGGHGGGERAGGRRRTGNCVALCHNLHGNQFVPSSLATTSSFTTVMT